MNMIVMYELVSYKTMIVMYERVLCDIVNWYWMISVTLAICLSSSGPAPPSSPPLWYSSVGLASGPRELIQVKMESFDTPPSRWTAVEPRHSQPGLFGWHTIPTSAKEVWPMTHTHTHTHTHTSFVHTRIRTHISALVAL